MPSFLLFTTLSTQGLQTLKATPERLFEVNREIEDLGGRVVRQWALIGPYDFLTVVEAESAAMVLDVASRFAARGSASIETLPAIPVDEFIVDLKAGGPLEG